MFIRLQAETDDNGKKCYQEWEECPWDKLQWVNLQSPSDEDSGNTPRNNCVDRGPGIIQDSSKEFSLQAQLVKGLEEGLTRQDDGKVVFTDHQVNPDTSDGGGKGNPASTLNNSGQVFNDGVDNVELDQETTKGEGKDNQSQ